MTTLASAVAIGDNQLIIDTPFAAGQIPAWVKIDTEMLYAGGQHFRTGTTLTLSSPATATHSSGATVTYAGRPYDADFRSATGGVGGGAIAVDNTVDPPADVTTLIAPGAVITGDEADLSALEGVQRIRLLGPFHVAFNAAGITGNGALLTSALTAGQIVQFVWVEPTIDWNWSEATVIEIQAAPNADPGNTYTAVQYLTDPGDDIVVQGDGVIVKEATSGDGSSAPLRSVIRVTEASRLVISSGVAASAGEADIYALIAEPAA